MSLALDVTTQVPTLGPNIHMAKATPVMLKEVMQNIAVSSNAGDQLGEDAVNIPLREVAAWGDEYDGVQKVVIEYVNVRFPGASSFQLAGTRVHSLRECTSGAEMVLHDTTCISWPSVWVSSPANSGESYCTLWTLC